MRAMICTKYGSPDVLKLQEVDKPFPKPDQIRIRIHATTVTSGDCRVRGFKSPLLLWLPMRLFLGIRIPRKPILGVEFAGEVEAIGHNVTRYKVGDQVYGLNGMQFGAHAEFMCISEQANLALMPASHTYEEAAAIPFAGTTALDFLRRGHIQKGQHVLIYGASGAVGTAAVQLAKHYGAEVTAVCRTVNWDLVQSLGADHVIDYTKEDFASIGKRYDLIFDAVGKISKSSYKKALLQSGRFVTVEGQGIAKVHPEDLEFLKVLVEMGKLKAVIDRSYPFEQIPEAHRYVEQGHKKGNVVIVVSQ
ncbi:NAD(P)-dependent alcohol dehydrogenase [Paenibacillus sp. N1-5-1-14]|uniref:NAD(P)-dependent alcohol dehydrogenase n=1 Tax=Paenibacillus radicibacter TaxID=2972488 RepID=UPI002159258D|nr:NAD(P)-dependent alcohol dehydrogenase [Paenibacillus radicibacter]MCR8643809.1 NAD(P)-dependent alcohol dehydrogenase [Paenibacillus radicibacter]